MNTRTRKTLIAAALIAATFAVSAHAADQDAFFEQQREMTEGYKPPYTIHPTARQAKPATLHQVQENDWLTQERTVGSGAVGPVPFPVPPAAPVVAAKSRPVPTSQTADNKWWVRERALDDGHAFPTPSASISGTALFPINEGG
jgi:hypothetical protein